MTFTIKAHEVQKEMGVSKSEHTKALKRLEDGVEKKKVKNLWMLTEEGKVKYVEFLSGEKKTKEVADYVGARVFGFGTEDEAGKASEGVGGTTGMKQLPLKDLVFFHEEEYYFNSIAMGRELEIEDRWRRELVSKIDERDKKHFTYHELEDIDYPNPSPNGAILLKESGFYEFVLTSKSPKAVPFKRWVCNVVLPSLRKDGNYYVGDEDLRKGSADELDYAIKVLDRSLTASRAKFEKVMPKEDNYRILNYLLTAIDHTKESCNIMSDMYSSILEKDRIIDVERSSNATYGDIKIKIDTLFKQHGAALDEQFLPQGKTPAAETYRAIFRIADLLSNGKMFKTSIKKGQVKTEAYCNAGFTKQIYEAIEIVIDRLNSHGMIWG